MFPGEYKVGKMYWLKNRVLPGLPVFAITG